MKKFLILFVLSFWIFQGQSFANEAKIWEFCGWIAWIACENWLSCELDGSYPDAGGTCVQNGNENTQDDMLICPMIYAPVCGVDGTTYGNSCMAGKVEIAYEEECSTPKAITQLENNFSSTIILKINTQIQKLVDSISEKTQEEKNNIYRTILEKANTVRQKYQNLSPNMDVNNPQQVFLLNLIDLIKLKIEALIAY